MQPQTLKNHVRYHNLWTFIMPVVLIALLIGSVINLANADKSNLYSASLLLVIVIFLIPTWWFVRRFALKAQDRAIRVEENFRHFLLTGKPFDKELRIGQIIALRFASDEELAELAQRAVREKMAPRMIKAAIKNWRGDYYRV